MLSASFEYNIVFQQRLQISHKQTLTLWLFICLNTQGHLIRINVKYVICFKATAEKLKCQQEAEQTAMTIELANRLVGGLASENVRWAESVANFKEQEKTLPGDVLLTTAFVSYVGCFTRKYRDNLMFEKWLPFLKGQSVSQNKT